jgi:hypothetical protein
LLDQPLPQIGRVDDLGTIVEAEDPADEGRVMRYRARDE